MLEFTDQPKAKITENTDKAEIYAVTKTDGMIALLELALQKMMEGQTTFSEIIAVTA
ncbi:MAG: hypothetical protein IH613_03055 [Desulfuromonadales bacterium]|nr:hypothetical protein [Desulfuromonadales bacterium]